MSLLCALTSAQNELSVENTILKKILLCFFAAQNPGMLRGGAEAQNNVIFM